MDAFFLDLRYALRQVARNPGLTLVAVLSLALGIGANTALYQIADRVLFRPLPVEEPERLASIVDGNPSSGRVYENTFREYTIYRDQSSAFTALAASSEHPAGLSTGEATFHINVSPVTRNYYAVLGIRPSLGRTFTGNDEPGRENEAEIVLGHALWIRAFGGDPKVIGRSVRLNGSPFTVIGVAPRGVLGIDLSESVDAWIPIRAWPLIATGSAARGARLSTTADEHRWLRVTGRLRPGVTYEQAQANIAAVRSRIQYVEIPASSLPLPTSVVPATSTLIFGGGGDLTRFVGLLAGVVGLTLLIACANLATLLLARGAARSQEFGIRVALGAGRSRLARQLMTESAVLSLLGGAAGVLVAGWTADLLRPFELPGNVAIADVAPELSISMVGVALVTAMITSLLIGAIPAVTTTARDPVSSLSVRQSTDTVTQSRTRWWLVTAQMALALTLVAGAGLFARSLRNALAVDIGFAGEGVGLVAFDLGEQRYDTTRARAFYAELRERVLALPGISGAALARRVPVTRGGGRSSVYVPRPGGPENVGEHSFNIIGDGFLGTIGVPVLRGRDFTAADNAAAPGVVIVNEAMARLAWPGEDPIGKRFWFGDPSQPSLEVVGVTRNGKYRSLREESLPYYYLPFAQHFDFAGLSTMHLVFRTRGDVHVALDAVRGVVRSLDRDVPLLQSQSVVEQLGALLMPQRLGTTVLGLLSLIGLVLAVTGIYGVIAYSVARRTREIGVRIALGAQRGDVLRLVLRQGLVPLAVGSAAGIVLVLLSARVAASFMYGVSPTDPVTLALALSALIGTSVVAMLVPAARATKIEPSGALRTE